MGSLFHGKISLQIVPLAAKKECCMVASILGHNTKTDKDITITIEERMSGMHVLGATGRGVKTFMIVPY